MKNAHSGWISSVAACKNTDLIASGSNDGFVRLWAYGNHNLSEKAKIPVEGFINNLEISADGSKLIVAVGQEHKLGRWSVNKKAKNSVLVIKLEYLEGIK